MTLVLSSNKENSAPKDPHKRREERLKEGSLIMVKKISGGQKIYLKFLCIMGNFTKIENGSIQEHMSEEEGDASLKEILSEKDLRNLPKNGIIEVWGDKNPETGNYHVIEYKKIQ